MGINSSGLKNSMLLNQPKTKPTHLCTSIPAMYLVESTGWSTTFWTDLKCCSVTTNAPRTFWSTAPGNSSSRHPGLGLELILHQAQNVLPLSAFLSTLTSLCISSPTAKQVWASSKVGVRWRLWHPMLEEEEKERMGSGGRLHTRVWTVPHPSHHLKQTKLHHALRLR